MEMIIDDLQFKGEPKLYANYLRQLAGYNQLLWWGYDWALALITEKWVKWINVTCWILDDVLPILNKDVQELQDYLDNPDSIDESIFTLTL